MKDRTIEYYDENAENFYTSTVAVNMQAQYARFESKLFAGAKILDCGCGSGRDSKYFADKGYSVVAIDGSAELCKKAAKYTGLDVQNMMFQEIAFEEEFDGIWACASLLHVPLEELPEVFRRLCRALKNNGVLYASFKFGAYRGERNGRFFTDLDEELLERLIGEVPELTIQEKYISVDARPDRDEKWLNAIIIKAN